MKIKKKKVLIFSDYGNEVGLGHISRAKVLENYIEKYSDNIFCYKYSLNDNLYLKKNLRKSKNLIFQKLDKLINKFKFNIIILNTSKIFEKKFGKKLIFNLNQKETIKKIISIDGYIKYKNNINKILIPNVFLEDKFKKDKKILYGWDKTLINTYKKKKVKLKKKYKILLIISGGTDKYKLASKLPKIINIYLKYNLKIYWIQGPFAKFDNKLNLVKNLKIIKKKKNLYPYINTADIVLVQFGVSFFEALSVGKPAVAYIPKGKENGLIIKNLNKNRCNVSQKLKDAILLVNKICGNYSTYYHVAKKIKKKFNFKKNTKLIKKFLDEN